MESLRKKVIMSAIVLAFALIATIGSTYAWFTVTTEVAVSGVQLNVQSDESLLFLIADGQSGAVLANPQNYTTSVDNGDFLSTSAYADLDTWKLGAVTAAVGESTDTNLTYTALFAKTGTTPNQLQTVSFRTFDYTAGTDSHVAASANSASGGYIQLDFYLLSQSATSEKVVIQDFEVTPTSPTDSVIAQALRLATHPGTDDIGGGDYTYTPDRIFAAADPDYLFDFTTQPGYNASAANGQGTSLVEGVRNALLADHSLFYTTGTEVASVSTETIASAATVANLDSNTPTLFTVYIYIEGWDIDANSDILNAAFTVSFSFALQETS